MSNRPMSVVAFGSAPLIAAGVSVFVEINRCKIDDFLIIVHVIVLGIIKRFHCFLDVLRCLHVMVSVNFQVLTSTSLTFGSRFSAVV